VFGASTSRINRASTRYGAALLLSLLAVGLTYRIVLFSHIPWTLSLLAVALVAWIGGVFPALLAVLVTTLGIYALILAPASRLSRDPTSFAQTLAFDLIALMIANLVSQRNRAVSALRTSEMHYRSVTETASDVVITIDSQSRILTINPAVKALFGYDPSELIGEEMLILMPEKYRTAHKGGIARYLTTGVRHIPWTGIQLPGRRKDGEEVPLEISFGSYTAAGGEQRFTGFIRDISDRRKAEAALMQNEKLAAVGRLASSIAHEINNPLEAVTNLLYLCRASSDLPEIKDYLKIADREVQRISLITNQTLQFHKQSRTSVAVRCEEMISGSLILYQGRLVNANIRIDQRHRATQLALCVEGEIRQVLNNLIGNAVDALPPQDGRILIRSRNATDWKSGRAGVVLTIADIGTGMSPETRAKIFEAFFSTKGLGGAGLGLWICCELVEHNEGRIGVRSSQRPGASGTVFTLFLPHPGDSERNNTT